MLLIFITLSVYAGAYRDEAVGLDTRGVRMLRTVAATNSRRFIAVLVLILGATAVWSTGSRIPNAFAYNCSLQAHCYGEATWTAQSGGGFHGVSASIRTNCQLADNTGFNFVNNEMWLVKSFDPVTGAAQYWEEVGVKQGNIDDHGFYFWADKRPGLEYREYAFGPANLDLNQYEPTEIVSSGDYQWRISIAGYVVTADNSFAGAAINIQAGTESTGSNNSYGSDQQMSWKATTNTWYTGWSSTGGSGHASISIYPRDGSGGTDANWISQYDWVRTRQGPPC